MVDSVLNGVRIEGLVAAVPDLIESASDLGRHMGPEQAEKVARATGIDRRRIAPQGLCTSDLALPAAEALLEDLAWPRGEVDLLLFVTQTADYTLPATACLTQERLGLAKSCAAFDLNLGCSGYIYGLWTAASLMRASRARRALLLAGDTTSQLIPADDGNVRPLFGDAVVATALSRSDDDDDVMAFSLGTDGAGGPYLSVGYGGFRDPASDPTMPPPPADGSRRLFMDGPQVFAFTLREVPGNIAQALALAGWSIEEVDAFVLHQANEMMLRHLARKIGIAEDQLALALDGYGNTSSASVPLTLVAADGLAARLENERLKLLLSGFGVGWSWGSLAWSQAPLRVCRQITVAVPEVDA